MGTLILNPKNLVVMCSWKNSKPFLSLVQPEWLTMVIHSVQLCVMAGLLLRQVSRLKIFTCFPWRQQKAEELKTSSKCIMTFHFINEIGMIMHSSQIHWPNSKLNKNKSLSALCIWKMASDCMVLPSCVFCGVLLGISSQGIWGSLPNTLALGSLEHFSS